MRLDLGSPQLDVTDFRILAKLEAGPKIRYTVYLELDRRPDEGTVYRKIEWLLVHGFVEDMEGKAVRLTTKGRDELRSFRSRWFGVIRFVPVASSDLPYLAVAPTEEKGGQSGALIGILTGDHQQSLTLVSGVVQMKNTTSKVEVGSLTGNQILAMSSH